MRYVVAHVINSPLGAVKSARLVITDVPDKTRPADVVTALEAAGLASGPYAEGGVPLGNHEVVAEGRNGWPKGIAGIEAAKPVGTLRELTADGAGARSVTWSRLTTPPTSDDLRRVTLRLTPAQHGAYTLAAGRAGQSLQQWCESALDSEAAIQNMTGVAAVQLGRVAPSESAS